MDERFAVIGSCDPLRELERQGRPVMPDALRNARERCAGRSFTAEYQQVPFYLGRKEAQRLQDARNGPKAAMDTDSSNGAPGAPVGASNGRT